jgi:hypothetical protein
MPMHERCIAARTISHDRIFRQPSSAPTACIPPSKGRHPMTPYMAQGAAMAIEDAAVLSRCLENVDREGVADAFRRFEATRKERTHGFN